MHPFTSNSKESVTFLGEERLIAAIRRWLGHVSPKSPFGIGDDCAVLPRSSARRLVTVDPVVFGRHFDDGISARSAGAKLLKRNLSDIAAMGGRPGAAVVALALDPRTRIAWLREFHLGIASVARRYGVRIVGGDLTEAAGMLAATLTLIGEASGPRILTRHGSKIGDLIFVTGALGGSLRTGHHHRFRPRLAEGEWLARRTEVRAMMDISDGLAKDLRALTPAGAAAALEPSAIPLRRGCNLRSALKDGEDYELVFAVARNADHAGFAKAWAKRFPRVKLTSIGVFAPVGKMPPNAIDLGKLRGYEHFR